MTTPRDDQQFLDAFESCAISGADFHHAEHVRLAWIYLRRLPLAEALGAFAASLKRFANHNGASGLYHETITWAYLFLIHERMNGEASFDEFRGANPELFRWKPSLLDEYYRPETLTSDRARRMFLLPDKILACV